MLIPTVIFGFFALGSFYRTYEYDYVAAWNHKESDAYKALHAYSDIFGESRRTNVMLVEASGGKDGNLLTEKSLLTLAKMDDDFRSLEVEVDVSSSDLLDSSLEAELGGRQKFSFEDLCARAGDSSCLLISLIDAFKDEEEFGKSVVHWPTHVNVNDGINVKAFPSLSLVAGGTITEVPCEKPGEESDVCLGGSSTLLFHYILDQKQNRVLTEENTKSAAERVGGGELGFKYTSDFLEIVCQKWEAAFLERAFQWDKTLQETEIGRAAPFATISMGIEGRKSEQPPLLSILLTCVLVSSYVLLLNTSGSLVYCKWLSALTGVNAAGLGWVGGTGLVAFLGVPWAGAAELVPFLVLGVGVDDMFVILNSYFLGHNVSRKKETATVAGSGMRDRIRIALEDAGIGITLTTTTTCSAFLVGLMTPFGAIRWFCFTMVPCLVMGYIAALTMFVAALSLDARREAFGEKGYIRTVKRLLFFSPFKPLPPGALGESLNASASEEADTDAEISEGAPLSPSVEAQAQAKRAQQGEGAEQTGGVSGRFAKLSPLELASLSLQAAEADNTGRWRPLRRRQWWFCGRRPSGGAVSRLLDRIPGGTGGERSVRRRFIKGVKEVTKEPKPNPGSGFRTLMRNYVSRVLVSPMGLMVSFLIYGGLVAYAGLNLNRLVVGGSYETAGDYDSYFRDFFLTKLRDFPAASRVDTLIYTPKGDTQIAWHSPEVLADVRQIHEEMRESADVTLQVSPLMSFLRAMEKKGETPEKWTETEFTEELQRWIRTSNNGRLMARDFIWEAASDSGLAEGGTERTDQGLRLKSFRDTIIVSLVGSSSIEYAYQTERMREIVNHKTFEGRFVEFFLPWSDSTQVMLETTLTNMIISIGIMAFTVSFAVSPLAALVGMVAIASVDIVLIGLMPVFGIALDQVASVILVLASGFSIDYIAHVCHTSTEAAGPSRRHRVVETLTVMGSAVIFGASSSIVSVLPIMSFVTNKYMVNMAAYLLAMIFLVGVFHGVLILPVVLSLIGPFQQEPQVEENAAALLYQLLTLGGVFGGGKGNDEEDGEGDMGETTSNPSEAAQPNIHVTRVHVTTNTVESHGMTRLETGSLVSGTMGSIPDEIAVQVVDVARAEVEANSLLANVEDDVLSEVLRDMADSSRSARHRVASPSAGGES
uniref:SSD domain-containing protein n=1 Tax=Chromera velia CCMP2878 TaxID=1169474 RepID=A0A0G4IFI5_9ALVE|eukprot:Cvel_14026.t1-p1 / transcript=Cvel_14026.t1 / gene=Cvel_14026 / organism=Chromera_velia_CCMP2878 / gene_product=Patched domain-containing protein 3, putative / transcript_product=Patched domain-containing protein 3, putative / location=Cvel_scaffold982:12871-18543(+) / protein_length=1161 / sequence_SO=supercontig / SO=protein_coding / is_pseudo=false